MIHKKVDISIVLATRGRLERLNKLLSSINNTTEDLSRIEVLLGVDYDDPTLSDIIRVAAAYPFEILVTIQKRSPNLNHDYINRLFSMARGEWFWVMNDDAEIITKGWDQKLHQFPRTGRPAYLDIKDNTRNYNGNGHFACFPMINKHAFKAMRFFFHPDVPTWGADKLLHATCLEANIIEMCHEIEVLHHMDADDEQHRNMELQMRRHGSGATIDVYDDVARLVRYKC